MENTKQKNLLILGSGMMVEPLIDYLLLRPENNITIASNDVQASKIISSRKKRCTADELDVINNKSKLETLIKNHDLIISFIPSFLHIHVAKLCLENNKNMVTASYISDEIKALESQVKEKKLIFMNEIGLDPGIDHIITHKIMDECKENGDKIIAYESWCGALPSPDAIDNPLLYKFSWSPRGALMALKNSVIYLENGIENEIKEENVLLSTVEKNFHKCFNFEGYYNRNSIKYKEIYHLDDAKTVIRGTIRYKGFCFLIQCFKNLKLFDNDEILLEDISWRKYFEEKIINNSNDINNFSVKYNEKIVFNTYGVQKNDFEFYQKLVYVAVCQINDEYLLKNDVNKLCTNFLEMLNFLNFSDNNLIVKNIINKYL